jgi:hypothetical protein
VADAEATGARRPPQDALEALARARGHARLAAAEAVAALRALLDAAGLAAAGAPSDELRGLSALARRLDALDAELREGSASEGALVRALAGALDAEIARWQQRSAEDPDARAVLRAFLGLRELLWELGVRSGSGAAGARGEPAAEAAPPRERAAPREAGRARAPRVQRVRVEG